jgi:NADPH:quinone reductase-like Zn-dependent oxidoreductase
VLPKNYLQWPNDEPLGLPNSVEGAELPVQRDSSMREMIRLICSEPAAPARLKLVSAVKPDPGPDQVLVRVVASSVNPIDVKRAAGYGQRLLSLKGAGRFPLVLGNDFVGVVEAIGRSASRWKAGDKVLGVLPTGRDGGAHCSHIVSTPDLLVPTIDSLPEAEQVVIPYSFTTVWLAMKGAGLSDANAAGLNVLVNGASGGLGQLALELLKKWGASVTAVCSTANVGTCRSLGAEAILDRVSERLDALEVKFDAGLNFGSWQDEHILLSRLRPGALGFATTVHPLLSNFDRFGFLKGALRSYGDWREAKRLAAARGARYSWTLFKPDVAALGAMKDLLEQKAISLPIGIVAPLSQAIKAFDHVARQEKGRAVLA